MTAVFKVCRKCGRGKPRFEFWVDPRNSDGLQSYCKPCNSRLAHASQDRIRTWDRIRHRAHHVRSETELLAALRTGQVFWW